MENIFKWETLNPINEKHLVKAIYDMSYSM